MLLAQSGDAKVADFGIARVVSSTFVTRTGALLGTAHYISPEQALGQPATFQSELYSLGVVLYETLAEEVPHGAETSIGLAMKHVNGLLRPLREVNASIPEGLNAVVMRLLDKDPEQRYGDTDELMADLERMGQGESPVTRQEDGNSPAFQENVLDHEDWTDSYSPGSPTARKEAGLDGYRGRPLARVADGRRGDGPYGSWPRRRPARGSKNEPADESSSTQPPDVQEDVVAEVEAVEVESAEQTTSSSDDSTGTSGTPSDGGDAVQGPAAQTDQGSPTAEVALPPGNAKQKSTTPTMEEDSSIVEVPNLTGLPVSNPFV